MTSRRRKKGGSLAVAVVITLVLGACTGDDAGAGRGTTELVNRTQTPAATGGTAGTGPAETAPPSAAPAAPDVVETGCSAGARSRLELTAMGKRIKVRFEVRRSPVGHSWHIVLRHSYGPNHDRNFAGTRVASESGDSLVVRWVKDSFGPFEVDRFRAKATDTQTGQVCKAFETWGGR